MRRPTTQHLADTALLQASTALRQANMVVLHLASTEVPHRVSTEALHQDKVNMARHRLKASTVHLLKAKDSMERRRQVSTVSDRRRAVLVDTLASSSTASPHQAGGTSIELLAVALVV